MARNWCELLTCLSNEQNFEQGFAIFHFIWKQLDLLLSFKKFSKLSTKFSYILYYKFAIQINLIKAVERKALSTPFRWTISNLFWTLNELFHSLN